MDCDKAIGSFLDFNNVIVVFVFNFFMYLLLCRSLLPLLFEVGHGDPVTVEVLIRCLSLVITVDVEKEFTALKKVMGA